MASILDLRTATLNFQPDFISMGFPAGSTIPIATACLQDVTSTLEEARYALLESFAHTIWYREKCEPADENAAIFFGKFYADDTALRLYAAGEHLANAIINMLEIKNKVEVFKKKLIKTKSVVSKQAIVGNYLIENDPGHEITKAIRRLKDSDAWQETRAYRDDWVHSKPPIINGMGIGYERRNRLQVSDTHIGISVGGGDEPKYSVDDLLGFIRPASFLFAETAAVVVRYYAELLKKKEKLDW